MALCSIVAAAAGGLAASSSPAAAVPLMFPTDQALVPVAVAGAFVLPAVLAAVWAGMARLLHRPRLLIAVGLAAVVGLAIAGYLNPALVPPLKL